MLRLLRLRRPDASGYGNESEHTDIAELRTAHVRYPCDGLVSHPGGVVILLVTS